MSLYHAQVKPLRSAKLSIGQISTESSRAGHHLAQELKQRGETVHLEDLEFAFPELKHQNSGQSFKVVQPTPSFPPSMDQLYTIDRPHWIALVVYLQMSMPDYAAELEAVMGIGDLHPRPTAVSFKVIGLLNETIDKLYDSHLNIQTFRLRRNLKTEEGVSTLELSHPPYTPIDGLKVMVTETEHHPISPFDQSVLKIKDAWGRCDAERVLHYGRGLYAKNLIYSTVPDLTSTKKSTKMWKYFKT